MSRTFNAWSAIAAELGHSRRDTVLMLASIPAFCAVFAAIWAVAP